MARPVAKPRLIAFDVLHQVHQGDAYANLVLPAALDRSGLDPRDKAFATELTYGCLRREGELDVVIVEAAARELSTIDPVALDVLRLGVYQALFMRVPAHAVVDQSVALVRHGGVPPAAGFVNAVLRRVTAQPADYWADVVLGATGVTSSHPHWIAREIEQALGQCGSSVGLEEALAAHNKAPRVTLALLAGLADRAEGDRRTKYSPVGVTPGQRNPGEDSRVREGVARVQDEGSQIAALALLRARELEPGERILDMCAGPGGKTALLAADALRHGALVDAVELQPHRVGLVIDSTRAITARDSETVTVWQGDSTQAAEGAQPYDRILLDAPCTGLGALRRRPEARWRKSPDDIPGLVALQRRLITRALESLKPGGLLAYVTCSPVAAETTEVIGWALERFPDARALDTPALVEAITREPLPEARRGTAIQLWTHLHGTDAMFIQLLTRGSP